MFLEAPPGFEPGIRVLQTRALPLGYSAIFQEKIGAGNGAQTRDLCLGKAALYQLSYSRKKLVVREGIEPPTRGFSVPCSTD